jgi:bifunctional non-homologous end joining protein LigD
LATVLAGAPPAIHYVDHLEGQGPAFFAECRRHGLEGVVSKRRDSLYVGSRTPGWLKAKFVRETDFVIGGFTPPKGSRTGLGAVLVGCYDASGRLLYMGKVGSGMDGRTLTDLHARLTAIERPGNPFADLPRSKVDRGTRWVEPRLVARVEFRGWSSENLLWHPAFQGLREDVAPTAVTEELVRCESDQDEGACHATASLRDAKPTVADEDASLGEARPRETPLALDGLQLTHPDRLLYAEAGITKLDVARFYVEIADWILPHVVDRPLSLVRCPDGAEAKCFFQKKAVAGTPQAVDRV